MPPPQAHAPPLLAIALLSMAVLGYQILLMRLFSIIQWHHFAYMAISLALLGYGVAGTVVTLLRDWLKSRFRAVFAASATLFGLAAVLAFLIAQRVDFNALEILWDPRQLLRLLSLYVILFVPFFFAGLCLCLSFVCCPDSTHRIYGVDLSGAASGCLLVIVLLFLLPPERVLQAFGALGFASALAAALHFDMRPRLLPLLLLPAGALGLFALPGDMTALRISEYKSLRQALLVPGARVVEERSSPLGLLSVVESPQVPFRHAPGLSLNADREPPPQLGVFIDAEGPAALTRYDGDPATVAYLDQLTSALPYHLLNAPEVLVLGAGAGSEVLQAVLHGARRIDAVELNPQLVDLVRERHADFAGHLYTRSGVQAHVAEARGYVAGSARRYDLIQVALLDTFGASTAGLYGLSETYLYTVEALQHYRRHLKPAGLLAITRWVTLPPRDALKLFGTAVAALEREGVTAPDKQLLLIRGWQTATLLVKNGEFTAADIVRARAFSDARSFDTEWYPGIRAGDSNRYNVLDAPWLFEGATALLGHERTAFIERYKFNIAPATDDRPWFFHFFRWQSLPEILALRGRGGLPLLELGYPVLVATLLQAAIASLVLIVLPLWLKRTRRAVAAHSGGRLLVYFASLGLAFMFIEIAFIQKFILLLAHPLYAVAVVLCAFLLFAGMGSRHSGRFVAGNTVTQGSREEGIMRTDVWLPVFGIVVLSALYLLLLPELFGFAVTWPDAARIALSVALIAPLAFCMGMPFPLAMTALGVNHNASVPWAYGINACTSVIGAVLAALLAIHVGFNGVIVLAMSLYLLAAATFPRPAVI